jgi:transposase
MSKNPRTAPAKPVTTKAEADRSVKDIRRATRKFHNAEEKIRIVLAGLRGDDGAWSRHRFE